MISIGLLCILGGCGVVDEVVDEVLPDTDRLDYNAAYGISDGEYTVMWNYEMTDLKAIDDGSGNVYMDVNTANKNFNSRIYWDEESGAILYATPDGMAEYTPDSVTYLVGDDTEKSDIPVVISRDGMLYISMDFIEANTKMDCDIYTDPNRVVIRTKWGCIFCSNGI